MRKLFTLIATAMLSLGAFAQDAKPIGLHRTISVDDQAIGAIEVDEAYGVKVTPIRGADAKYREENGCETADASDLFIGYSLTEKNEDGTYNYAGNKSASGLYAEDCVIYPKVAEQSARQAEEYFGFKVEIPAGKTISVEKLNAYLLAGNAYQWQVEITNEAGDVLYKTQDKGIKINNYNKTCYTNAVTVTADAVTEPEWSNELYVKAWSMAENYSVADTPVLTDAVKDLSGTIYVKVYYWGKWQKNLSFANIQLYVTGEGGEDTGNVAGIYRTIDVDNFAVGPCSVAETLGVKVTPIRGADAKYREENGCETADASDLFIGYSLTELNEDGTYNYAANKSASGLYAEDCVIYPKVAEQSARQAEEYFGYTMEIPAGTSVNIEKLDAYLLAGNAYQWQVEITNEAGDVLYKTQDKGIKINNYNKTCYTNAVTVTADAVTEPVWSNELYVKAWSMAENYSVADTPVLTDAVKNLTGTITVKVYYWGKWQKNLTYANVLVTLSEGEGSDEPTSTEISELIAGKETLNLKAGKEYTLNAPAVAEALKVVTINANGATIKVGAEGQFVAQAGIIINDAIIDASESPLAPVALSATPDASLYTYTPAEGETPESYKYEGANQKVYESETVQYNNCTVITAAPLFNAGTAAWALKDLTVNNTIVEVKYKSGKAIIDVEEGANSIKDITVKNSTIYADDAATDMRFIRYTNASNAQAQKVWGTTGTSSFTIENSTFVNVCGNKEFANNYVNKNNTTLTWKNNLFANVWRLNKIGGNNVRNFAQAENMISGGTNDVDGTDAGWFTSVADLGIVWNYAEAGAPAATDNIEALGAIFAPYKDYASFGDPRWAPYAKENTSGIHSVTTEAVSAVKKYIGKNGIVIEKNGQLFNVAGSMIK